MLLTNKATPTFIGKATLEGKGIRLFIPNGFASGEVAFLALSLTFSLLGVLAAVFAASGALSLSTTSFASVALSLLTGGFIGSVGLGLAADTLGVDDELLLVVSGLDWAKTAVVVMFAPAPIDPVPI
jgi:hypothetical protein